MGRRAKVPPWAGVKVPPRRTGERPVDWARDRVANWCGPCQRKARLADERDTCRIWVCDRCDHRWPEPVPYRELTLFGEAS